MDTRANRVNRRFLPIGCQHGFTLVEMMVALAILAILLAIAVPSLDSALLASKLRSQANGIVASAVLARNAATLGAPVTLCVPNSDWSDCGTGGWEQGWLVLTKKTSVVPNVITIIDRHVAAPTGIKITEASGATAMSFTPTGGGATSITLKICRNSPTVGSEERMVMISATGRATIAKTTTATCA